MNHIYPPEPALCPPEPIPDRIGEAVDSEIEYRTRHQALALYADQLGEAFSEDGLGDLPRLLRDGTDAEVRAEIERLFDSYWSRQLRRQMQAEEDKLRREHDFLRGFV